MVQHLIKLIDEIKVKENNVLIVLKGFDNNVFKALSDTYEPAFFSKFYDEKEVLKTLLANKKKLHKKLLLLEEGTYIAQYEEFLIIQKNLDLYENKIFILENNLFNYYLYNFDDKEEIQKLIKLRESEIVASHDDNTYEYFYSDIISSGENVYVAFRNLEGIKNIDGTEINIVKVFSFSSYSPIEIKEIDENNLTNIETYSINNLIKNEELKYKIFNHQIKDRVDILIDRGVLNKAKFQYELGSLKYICDLNSVTLTFYQRKRKEHKFYRKEIKTILEKYWNSSEFRELKFYAKPDVSSEKITISQGEIIEEIIEEVENSKKKDFYNNIFITAPTGAGKSIFFQIPALYLEKNHKYLTIVISPLKALMKDQVENLKQKGINSACFLNSDLSFIEKNRYIEKIKRGEKSIIYLSPELLQGSSDITTIIGDREIGLVVIDEAHTVSTWGKNFRIDYLLIGNYVKKIELYKKYKFPILALTATAIYGGESDTVHEILKELKIDSCNIHIGEVRKDNIHFKVNDFIPGEGSYNFLKEEKTRERIKEKILENKKSIFYFPYAKHASETYAGLNSNIMKRVAYYTGKLDHESRIEAQEEFRDNVKKIMLATKAFGMGVDIPDIENIYHYGLSGDLADYVQEIGRCARNKDVIGVAEIDFNKLDLKYPKMLRSISGVKQWQMKLVIEKLFELYKLNNYKSTFLLSIESFSHIFTEKEKDLEKKVKQALLFLEKDLLEKYTFPVIIARPKAFFSSLYVVIRKENEKDILTDENKDFFIKVMEQKDNSRIRRGYDFRGHETETFIYDTGDIYEFKVSEYWERYYDNISFPLFIRDFFKGEIFNKEFVSNRIKLKIELIDKSEKIFSDLEYYLDTIFKAITRIKGYFTKEQLEDSLKIILESNNKAFIRKLTNIILTYSFIASPTYQKADDKFLRIKKDLERNEDKYILVQGNFSKFKSSIIRSFLEMFDRKKEDSTFIKYISNDSKFLEVATLLQALELGSFEVTGGNTPKIFFRINDPSKLEYLSKIPKYSNSVLSNIEKVGKNADKIIEEFFSTSMSNIERWNYIEDYFLGRI